MLTTSLVSIVDDDPFFCGSMQRLLKSLGYTVEAFQSAADFLASDRFAETACLIADVQMPAMTGFELYRHLIAGGHAIPTILVTGGTDDVDRMHSLDRRVICCLPKPIDEERLLQCLRAALGNPPEGNS
jgi:FixJ family two-component response regulator